MKRGEIWTVAGGPDYAGKPRPAIVIQSNLFDATSSVTICPLTATPIENVYARFELSPTKRNGLQVKSFVMVDKIMTLPRAKIGYLIGQLAAPEIALLDQRLALFLGLGE